MKKFIKSKKQRIALEKKIKPLKKIIEFGKPPKQGWIRSIRKSLGLTIRQIADICEISHSSIRSIERNEVLETASIRSLKKLASAMDCKLVYVVVPDEEFSNLENIIDIRCEKLAKYMVRNVYHSMSLERRMIPKREREKIFDKLFDKLKNSNPLIWKPIG